MTRKKSSSQWISLSDMMTGLMLIFLLLSVVAMQEVDKQKEILEEQKKELEKQKDNQNKILLEYNNIKEKIHIDLKKAFKEKEKEWEMQITDDLRIKFTNDKILFELNKTYLTQEFKNILDKFIPNYLEIINKSEYIGKIIEVRIEGHAGNCKNSTSGYMECLTIYSQGRANNIVKYILNHKSYKELSDKDKQKMKFLITSNGFSNGKNIDSDGYYIYESGKKADFNKSRRVEFSIQTNSEELVDTLLKNK